MSRRNDNTIADIMDLVSKMPWQVGVSLAVGVFVVLRFVLPLFQPQDLTWKMLVGIGHTVAPFLALVFLLPAGYSALRSHHKRGLLDRQGGIDSIQVLSWKEFEELLGEAYRRRGYRVIENDGHGPDGGVDLRIEKDGNSYLVQCKHWKAFKVPVGVVREMLGLMVAERATGVIIVTSGMFTQEARDFAEGKPIDLIEGNQLADMIRNVQTNPSASLSPPRAAATENSDGSPAEHCPRCGNELVLREARRGEHAGKKFWGCKGYPACRYIRNHDG